MTHKERAISTSRHSACFPHSVGGTTEGSREQPRPGPCCSFRIHATSAAKLVSLDSEFRTHHFALIDVLEEEEGIEKEQVVIDEHEDHHTDLSAHVECLVNHLSVSPSTPLVHASTDERGVASRRLCQLERRLSAVKETLSIDPSDECAVRQLEEEIADLKSDLRSITDDLARLDLDDGDELLKIEKSMRESMYNYSLKAKRLVSSKSAMPTSTTATSGMKLPKTDFTRFDGNILNWRLFWDQFNISIHSRTSLSNSEKLTYLQS